MNGVTHAVDRCISGPQGSKKGVLLEWNHLPGAAKKRRVNWEPQFFEHEK